MAHISLVTLGVDDLDRASAFYEATGWRRSQASVPGTITFLRGGAIVLALFPHGSLAADAGLPTPADGEPARPSIALAMNVASEQLVDRALDDAERAGGRITKPAQRADWGGYSGYLSDPDGHLWEVAHNPLFPLADDGTVRLPDDP